MKSLERINKKYETAIKEALRKLCARRKEGTSAMPKKIDVRAMTGEHPEIIPLVAKNSFAGNLLKDRGSKLNRNKATLNKLNMDFSKKGKQDIKRDMKISALAFKNSSNINKFGKFLRKRLILNGFNLLSNYSKALKEKEDSILKIMEIVKVKLRAKFEIIKDNKPLIRSCLRSITSAKKSKVCFADPLVPSPRASLTSTNNKTPARIATHCRYPSIHLNKLRPQIRDLNSSLDIVDLKRSLRQHMAAILIQKYYKKWRFRSFLAKHSLKKRAQNESFVEVDLAQKESTCLIM